MIPYKPAKYRELQGVFRASIIEIEVEGNSYYNPEFENSSPVNLNISFSLVDPITLEIIPFTQKFINPLTGGKGLFQQLLDIIEFLPDEDGGEFNEQSLVGLQLEVTMGRIKNKNGKEYDNVLEARKLAGNVQVSTPAPKLAPPVVVEETQETDDDLPF